MSEDQNESVAGQVQDQNNGDVQPEAVSEVARPERRKGSAGVIIAAILAGALAGAGTVITSPIWLPHLPLPVYASLETRFAHIEHSIALVRQHPSEAVQADLKTLDTRLAALEAKAEQTPAAATADPALQERIARLEGAAAAAKTEMRLQGQPPATENAGPSLRLAIALDVLNQRISANAPFADAYNAAAALGADATAMAVLKPFADKGLPDAKSLGKELAALVPKLFPEEPAPSGILPRLWFHAAKLVRVTTRLADPGASPEAVVQRMGAAIGAGNWDEAISLNAMLPDALRARTAPLMARVEARQNAEKVAQTLLDQVLSGLAAAKN